MEAKIESKQKVVEGSRAVAEAIKVCRPNIICAYPITPQTHVVAELAQMVADGDLKAEYVNADSELSAASIVLGASATGARAYTSSTSQGLLLMIEVLYNIGGMRLPAVLSCVNRSVSAPLNIWNDHQDSLSARDSGWIQLYAEDNQEAADMHIQAYRIGEDHRVLLPVMVCLDGFIISHTYEPVELMSQEDADRFLPPYDPLYILTPKNPLTFGCFAEPDKYMETRYMINQAMERAKEVIEEVAGDFKKTFGRYGGGLIDTYQVEDAETVFVAMGSIIATVRNVVDHLRAQGKKAGLLKVRAFRPFPKEAIREALEKVRNIVVIEKSVSLGSGGILGPEIKNAFYRQTEPPKINTFIAGLGGRDVTDETLIEILSRSEEVSPELEFVDLKPEIMEE